MMNNPFESNPLLRQRYMPHVMSRIDEISRPFNLAGMTVAQYAVMQAVGGKSMFDTYSDARSYSFGQPEYAETHPRRGSMFEKYTIPMTGETRARASSLSNIKTVPEPMYDPVFHTPRPNRYDYLPEYEQRAGSTDLQNYSDYSGKTDYTYHPDDFSLLSSFNPSIRPEPLEERPPSGTLVDNWHISPSEATRRPDRRITNFNILQSTTLPTTPPQPSFQDILSGRQSAQSEEDIAQQLFGEEEINIVDTSTQNLPEASQKKGKAKASSPKSTKGAKGKEKWRNY